MRKILQYTPDEVLPTERQVFQHQGIPPDGLPSDEAQNLLKKAFVQARELSDPIAVCTSLRKQEFARVLEGEGANSNPNPVQEIFPQASHLALFAATLGPRICDQINKYFQAKDCALGYMLDSVASLAADQIAVLLQADFRRELDGPESSTGVLGYSPGYCGWHVSGQRKLFEFLEPGEIGISLNPSFLMSPIKSVSGVLIAGPRQIHVFPNSYSFCPWCTTKNCRSRIKELLYS